MADLPQIRGVTYTAEPEEHVFSMMATRTEEVVEPAAGPDEPEVVAKGKKEDE